MQRFGKVFWFLATFPTLFGFDWGTKELARGLPVGGEITVVPGWVSWFHAENPYVAFSTPVPLPVIFAFGFVAIVGLLWTLWRLPADSRVHAVALGTLSAGALGNLADRFG